MPVRIWKEVLCPGRQRDRHGNWFEYKPRDIRRAAQNVAKMLSRRVPLPCVWEHQDVEAGDPAAWKAAYAKYTFGHVAGQRINGRGRLELLHDVRDPRDAEQLLKTRFVSPKVYPTGYSDSRGGEYRGATIAHVAATPTPVQFWQRPFEMSRADALYMSYTPEGPTVAKKDAETETEVETETETPAGKAGELNALIEALREVGLTIPEEVQDIPGLIIAVKAGGAKGDDFPLEEEEEEEEPPQTSGETAAAPGAPMLMSDDRAKGYAKRERVDLERRVNRLFSTGRIDRPTAQGLMRKVKAVELSFTAAGDLVPHAVTARVEAYEELPKGQAWKRDGKARGAAARDLSVTEVPHPDQLAGEGEGKLLLAEQERLAAQYSSKPAAAK